MIRILLGGSPCTHWSIAQKNGRETQPNSGFGWDLFLNYKIALEKWNPDYFLYENNKSASKAIKDEICKELGYPLQNINSSLLSAQSRDRFYVRNWYCPIPKDRKIYMDDIITQDDLYPYNGGSLIRMKEDLSKHYDGCWQIGRTGKSNGQAVRVYDMKGKSVTLKSQAGGGGGKTGLYLFDGKVYSLNASGAEKLQTVPTGYTDCVPKDVAISLIGNGWTVDVIKHQLSYIPNILNDDIEVLSMYDGISCGQIALSEMGCNIKRYYSTEIDENAIKVTQHNFPNTIQLGDAFQVRDDGWMI